MKIIIPKFLFCDFQLLSHFLQFLEKIKITMVEKP